MADITRIIEDSRRREGRQQTMEKLRELAAQEAKGSSSLKARERILAGAEERGEV